MTAINIVSVAVYLRGFSAREKVQTYVLAAIFLVLLYNSPSGLVFYWILNNLFSLCKNLVNARCKNPRRFVHRVLSVLFVAVAVYIMITKPYFSFKKKVLFLMASLLVAAIPLILKFVRKSNLLQKLFYVPAISRNAIGKNAVNHKYLLFASGGLALAFFLGLVLPASVISTSPSEFSFIGNTNNPTYYVWHTLVFYMGLFVVWASIVYAMFGERVKSSLQYMFPLFFICALLNVYVFGFDYGLISEFFVLNVAYILKSYPSFYAILPLLAMILVLAGLFAVRRFRVQQYLVVALFSLCTAEVIFGGVKLSTIDKTYKKIASQKKEVAEITPIYHLSKTQKNVVVLFLDRSINSFFPYIVKQFPHLADDFDGFTYYPNTLSFSTFTAKASPAMVGGYEYTPENENKRADELLVDKHDEALLVMPRIFDDAGYSVTVTDPPFPNYYQDPFAPYRKYPSITCDFVEERYAENYLRETTDRIENNLDIPIAKNAITFCAMEAVLPALRNTIYNGGKYFHTPYSSVIRCVGPFSHLYYLGKLTDAKSEKPAFMFIGNDLAHTTYLLKEPDYVPSSDVREKDATCGFWKWRVALSESGNSDLGHYHVTTASILQTARWLNHLKELGVYDNTRIIVVADHGNAIVTPAFGDTTLGIEKARFNPLLLVKDFNERGAVKTSNKFMTNADTVLLAREGLPVSDTNPFTHKNLLEEKEKTPIHIYNVYNKPGFNESAASTYLTKAKLWRLTDFENNNKAPDAKYDFRSYHAFFVHDDIFKDENWIQLP